MAYQHVADSRTLVSDSVAVTALAFCLLVPFSWDTFGWVMIAGFVIFSLLANRDHLKDTWIPLLLVPYAAWIALSLFWSIEPVESIRGVILFFIYTILAIVIAVGRRVEDLLRVTACMMGLLLVANWLFLVAVPGIAISQEDHAGAMKGLFVQKNALGYFAVLSFVTLGVYSLISKRGWNRRLAWSGTLLAVVTVFASTSKTAVSVAIVVTFLGLSLAAISRLRKPVTLALLLWIVVLGVIGGIGAANYETIVQFLGRDPTLTNRTNIWAIVGRAIIQRPLQGYGWNSLWTPGTPFTEKLWSQNYDVPFYHAHSGYLDLTAQVGLVGAAMMILLLARLLWLSGSRFLRGASVAAGWPLVLVLVVIIYNSTEVVAFTKTSWILVLSLLIILGQGEELCTSPTLDAFLRTKPGGSSSGL